MSIMVTFYHF